jgi:hypothetical protein
VLGPIKSPIVQYRCSFRGVKRPERDNDRSSPSIAEAKDRVELYLYSPYTT